MKTFATAVGSVIGGLGVVAFVVLLLTWPSMLMMGVVHSFWPAIPALGFWHVLLLKLTISLFFPSTSSSKD